MARPLTTDDIKQINELVEAVNALKTWTLAMDDGLGINPPWQVSIATLAKLLVPFNGATNDLDLNGHDVKALKGFFDTLRLTVNPANVPTEAGAVYYDAVDNCYNVVLPSSEVQTLAYLSEVSDIGIALSNHMGDTENPHAVTKAQVGLGNADNTSDADKPVSTAQQAELDLKIPLAQKGQASGVATLGADGLVPSAQLPSYVDDVLEYDSLSLLPETGETSKIYVTLDTNLTYRWSGSGYTEISKSLALGETEATAYRGDRGKTAYDHTLLADNPHSVTKEQVGLGNADNTSDADKPVSNAQQTALNLKESVANVNTLKGTDWAGETVKGNAEDIATLNADATTAGSVAKTVKDAVEPVKGTGWAGETVKGNADEIEALDARIVDVEAHVYGLDFNETTGVSTRLLDAVGKAISSPNGTTAITSDFDNIYPWSEMRHVKVNMDGVRKEQYVHDYDSFDGEIMTVLPRFYYKDYRSGGHRYMYISDKKKAGFKLREESLIASFPASKVGTEYRSRVGEAPKTNENYATFIQGFYAQGDGKWSMYDCLHALVLLTCIEAGTMNHKGAYGRGINSGMPYGSTAVYLLTADTVAGNDVVLADSAQPFYVGMTVQIGTAYTNNSVAQDRVITNVVRAGGVLTLTLDGDPFSAVIGNSCVTWGQSVPQNQFDTIGDGSGYILQHESANRSHVCYRGIWDLWGNVWQFYAGFMRYDGRYYGCTDPTKYNISDPRGADGWVDLGIGEYADNGYQQVREAIEIEGGVIDVPVTWGATAGSDTFYSAFLYYFSSGYSGARVLRLGGSWGSGGYVSLVYSDGSGSPSSASVGIGSRLIRS